MLSNYYIEIEKKVSEYHERELSFTFDPLNIFVILILIGLAIMIFSIIFAL